MSTTASVTASTHNTFDWKNAPPSPEELMFRKQLGDALSKDFPAMTALAVGSLDSRSLWAVTDQCWRLTRALWVWKDSQGPQLPSRQAYARATTDLQTSLPGRYTKEEDHQLDKVLKAPGATRVLQEVAS
jgi:hypothetical protein